MSLAESKSPEKFQNGNGVSLYHDRYPQISSSHLRESPAHSRANNGGASVWHSNTRAHLTGHQSLFPGLNGYRSETKPAEKDSESPVETNGSDLLNGSAPDVDGDTQDFHVPSWRVSAAPGFPPNAANGHETSKISPQDKWLLLKGFKTDLNTGGGDSKVSSGLGSQHAINGTQTFTSAIGKYRNRTAFSQSSPFYQTSNTGIMGLDGTQAYPERQGIPLTSANMFGSEGHQTTNMFANNPTSNNHQFGAGNSHHPSSQIPYSVYGDHEIPARQPLPATSPYVHMNGFNISHPTYSNSVGQGFRYEPQRAYPRAATLGDRETLSPATSDYRSSWRTPDHSTSITPLTGSNSVRSNSGYGYEPQSIIHDPMLLERKLRNLDLQSRDQQYTMSSNIMNGARPAHLSYAAGMRMNPLAHPYVSSHLTPHPHPHAHGINHTGPMYGQLDMRNHGTRSALLDDFRLQHRTGKRYELKDLYHHIVEFSGDQHGSRFIQEKLQTANSDEKERVFAEIRPNAIQLMTDVFGNYVIQKLFEHGSQTQKKILANQMKGRILSLSLQMYGCRVVQKALEHVLVDQQASIVRELEGVDTAIRVIMDGNGNHVIQKAIERVPGEHIQFIIDAHRGQVAQLASHAYGCRVIQRILEYCQPNAKRVILDELHLCIPSLINNQFGNYVVQHLIQNGNAEDRRRVIDIVQRELLVFSKHKFASNVVEKSLEYAEPDQRAAMLRQLTTPVSQGQTPVFGLLRDQYGNYVIQKVFAQLQGAERVALLDEIKKNMVHLRRTSYGKQISAIEKLIADSEKSSNREPELPPSLEHSFNTSPATSLQSNAVQDDTLGTPLPSLLSSSEKVEVLTNSDSATITH